MRDNEQRIHDFQSFAKDKKDRDAMSALALEMQEIVFRAAQPVRPGEIPKAQMRRAFYTLQKAISDRPLLFWRVRAAWNGEAGCWVGVAHEDLRERDRALRCKEAEAREQARKQQEEIAAICNTAAERLRSIDADFHSSEITRLERAARSLGEVDSALVGVTD